jgi:glucosamine--fructose-6-phosphate aminotransferase (isomerizing)
MSTLMATEMAQQPEVLALLAERAPAMIDSVRSVIPAGLRGVTWVARGSSDNAAVLGRYLAELSSGRPCGLAAPSLITRYNARLNYSGELVVGLSQSGETPEIVDVCRQLRVAGARVVAITNNELSALASAADVVLPTLAGAERAVPATKTVTAQMLVAALVASAVGSLTIPASDLARLVAAVEGQLREQADMDELAARWSAHRGLTVVARGLTYAAARESALKVREVAAMHAEALSAADFLHGPIAAAGPDLPVLLLGGDAPTDADLAEVSHRLVASGTPQHELHVARALPRALQPIVATVAGQQLALALALNRGLNPDSPAGLTKVTLTH